MHTRFQFQITYSCNMRIWNFACLIRVIHRNKKLLFNKEKKNNHILHIDLNIIHRENRPQLFISFNIIWMRSMQSLVLLKQPIETEMTMKVGSFFLSYLWKCMSSLTKMCKWIGRAWFGLIWLDNGKMMNKLRPLLLWGHQFRSGHWLKC